MSADDTTQQEQEREAVVKRIHRQEEEERARQRAEKAGVQYKDYRASYTQPSLLQLVPEERARTLGVAAAEKNRGTLMLAARNPANKTVEELAKQLRKDEDLDVVVVGTSQASLDHLWSGYQKTSSDDQSSGESVVRGDVIAKLQQTITGVDDVAAAIEEQGQESTSAFLEIVFGAALALRASDVHFERAEEAVRLRYRIDGVLYTIKQLDPQRYRGVLSRIKLLSEMKMNVSDTPQDGRFTIAVDDRPVEVRSAVAPSEYGEDIVLRILDPATIQLDVDGLGLRPDMIETIRKTIHAPNGLILTTGPTGSGKTTTLYSFVRERNEPDVKIITIEDPVEYHLSGVEQTEVDPNSDTTFFTGLTAALRRDPDIILVGEIRDDDTASAAVQAALTGHIVFSTLHTNDAAGAIPRLIDLNVKPSLIPSALRLVIAQRLVRRICQECAVSYTPDDELQNILEDMVSDLPDTVDVPALDDATLYKPGDDETCPACGGLQYQGRIGVFEALIVDEEMEELIASTPSIAAVRKTAIERGMVPMKHDGLLKALNGITTLEEVERVFGAIQ